MQAGSGCLVPQENRADVGKEKGRFNLLETIRKAFAEYEEKMKSLAVSLEDEAHHLEQLAAHCNQVSEECMTVGDNIARLDS